MSVKTVTIPLATFEQMHCALLEYKFLLCNPRGAGVFMRDYKIDHLKKLQTENEPLYFSTPEKARNARVRRNGVKW